MQMWLMQNYKVIMQIDFSLSLCTNIRSSNQGSVSPSFFFYLLPLSLLLYLSLPLSRSRDNA